MKMQKKESPTIVIIGHGSRIAKANRKFEQFVDGFRLFMHQSTKMIVRHSYLELAKPSMETTLEDVTESKTIVVIPLLLLRSGHAKNDIPLIIEKYRNKFPYHRWLVTDVLGVQQGLIEICRKWIEEIERIQCLQRKIPQGKSLHSVILLGRGSSDPDANGDFFKIMRLLGETIGKPQITPAFAGISRPNLNDAMEQVALQRPEIITIIPYLLFEGLLTEKLQAMIQQFQNRYSWITIKRTPVLSVQPQGIYQIMKERVADALNAHPVKLLPCDNCLYRIPIKGHEQHVNGIKALLYSIRHTFTHTQAMPDRHCHSQIDRHILICSNVNCSRQGSLKTRRLMEREIRRRGWYDRIKISSTSCLGMCGQGPSLIIYPDGIWYRNVGEKVALQIIDQHLKMDRLVKENIYTIMG